MTVTLHWFLPTNGDSRSDLSLGNAVGTAGSRVLADSGERAPDTGYMGQIRPLGRAAGLRRGADPDEQLV
jgi:alkanesulfonate monooxygenase